MARGSPACAAPTFVQRVAKIEPRGSQSGNQSKENSGKQRCCGREHEDPTVNTDRAHVRDDSGRKFEQRAERGVGKQQTKRASDYGDENTLREQLANDADPHGTERGEARDSLWPTSNAAPR